MASPVGAFVLGDRFLWANPAWEETTGLSGDELAERSLTDLLPADARPACAAACAALLAGSNDKLALELHLLAAGGLRLRLDATLTALDTAAGRVIVGAVADAGPRLRAVELAAEIADRLELTQRAGRSAVWEWIPDTDELLISDNAADIFGLDIPDELRTGRGFFRAVHPEDRERMTRALQLLLHGAPDLAVDIRLVSPHGETRWLAERAVAVRDEGGRAVRVTGVAHDISERKIAEEALFQEKERADVTLASIADGVVRTDSRGAIDYLNPVAERLTGWTLAEAYGRHTRDVYRVIDADSRQPLLDPIAQSLEDRREVASVGEHLLVHRQGGEVPVHDSAAPIRNREGKVVGAILVVRDLTQVRDVEDRMRHLATHDPLTGLANRRGFEARLHRAFNSAHGEGRQHALCHLDLDRFRLVNDTCGHAGGDQFLLRIASTLRQATRGQDLVARLGGDEFGLLLEDCPTDQAANLVEEVRRAVGETRFEWQEQVFTPTLSGGLVAVSGDSDSINALLQAADAACSVAKEAGGNRVHLSQLGDEAVAERYGQMRWVSRIHQALEADRFRLYYQPIRPLAAADGRAALAEVFLRLVDEKGEVILPGEFIPAAERYGLISAIDQWVVRHALEAVAAMEARPADPVVRLAVNLSGQSLGTEGFLEFVIRQFEETGGSPQRLYFEITETAAIADLATAIRFISVIKEMGSRFILDDFGKGLSSLGYLQNLPLDYLKADGEFVRNLTGDPIQAALVAFIQQLGEVMGLKTIAESVEDGETLDALRRIGFDYAQGFYLARPRPLDPSTLARDLS